ncbi:hypothetical protein [Planomicrobium okeanokoites]|uniref:hypothetical protein n=1 Tax=Planomicrobium okeanokoites TaxID=244 RepID=UPI0031F18105
MFDVIQPDAPNFARMAVKRTEFGALNNQLLERFRILSGDPFFEWLQFLERQQVKKLCRPLLAKLFIDGFDWNCPSCCDDGSRLFSVQSNGC